MMTAAASILLEAYRCMPPCLLHHPCPSSVRSDPVNSLGLVPSEARLFLSMEDDQRDKIDSLGQRRTSYEIIVSSHILDHVSKALKRRSVCSLNSP